MIQNSDSFSYCDSKLYDNTIQRFTLYFFTLICMYFNGILCLNMFFISINIFESQFLKYWNDTGNMMYESDSFSYYDSKLCNNTIQRLTLYFFTLILMIFNGIL